MVIIDFLKEYDFLFTILFSAIAAIFAIMAYYQSKRSDKEGIRRKIAQKQAELDALSSNHHFIDGGTMNDTIIRQQVLSSEIEEYKKML